MTTEHPAAPIIERFLDWATDPDLLILDTETTGLHGEVIELGVIDNNGRVLLDERFNPRYPIEPGAEAVHGISMSDVQDCPRFGERWPDIRDLLDGRRVLIYNAPFDTARICTSLDATLPRWYEAEGGSPGGSRDLHVFNAFSRSAECVMDEYAPLAGNWNEYYRNYQWVRLALASAQRDVDTSDLRKHAAASDCEQVRRLVQACAALDPEDFPWIGKELQPYGTWM